MGKRKRAEAGVTEALSFRHATPFNASAARQAINKVFESMLKAGDVSAFKRFLMFHSVDNFQKFCGWDGNNRVECGV